LGVTPTTTLNGSGSFSLTCAVLSTYTVALDKGVFGTSILARDMQVSGGGALLGYQLYQDSAHSVIFGDGVNGSTESGTLVLGGTVTINVFGQIPSQSVATAGAYSDNVTITVTF
jgi:spore coat protein U-like protein